MPLPWKGGPPKKILIADINQTELMAWRRPSRNEKRAASILRHNGGGFWTLQIQPLLAGGLHFQPLLCATDLDRPHESALASDTLLQVYSCVLLNCGAAALGRSLARSRPPGGLTRSKQYVAVLSYATRSSSSGSTRVRCCSASPLVMVAKRSIGPLSNFGVSGPRYDANRKARWSAVGKSSLSKRRTG